MVMGVLLIPRPFLQKNIKKKFFQSILLVYGYTI
jgi:hypothetical protein